MNVQRRGPVLRLHSAEAPSGDTVSPQGNTRPASTHSRRATDAAPRTVLRPALRLSDEAPESPAVVSRRSNQVAGANRLASGMSPDDARWIFARRVAEQLEGGKSAILTPERRRSLIATAQRVGLRDFDASLVIAIVQDGRRSGHGGLNPEIEQSLLLIRPGETPKKDTEWLRFGVAALALGGLMAWMMARWVTG